MAFDRPIWRENLPTGSYLEGRDLVLGRFCAFSYADHVEIHHFDRPLSSNPKGQDHEPRAAHLS